MIGGWEAGFPHQDAPPRKEYEIYVKNWEKFRQKETMGIVNNSNMISLSVVNFSKSLAVTIVHVFHSFDPTQDSYQNIIYTFGVKNKEVSK